MLVVQAVGKGPTRSTGEQQWGRCLTDTSNAGLALNLEYPESIRLRPSSPELQRDSLLLRELE